jgi:hypothetical protein
LPVSFGSSPACFFISSPNFLPSWLTIDARGKALRRSQPELRQRP